MDPTARIDRAIPCLTLIGSCSRIEEHIGRGCVPAAIGYTLDRETPGEHRLFGSVAGWTRISKT